MSRSPGTEIIRIRPANRKELADGLARMGTGSIKAIRRKLHLLQIAIADEVIPPSAADGIRKVLADELEAVVHEQGFTDNKPVNPVFEALRELAANPPTRAIPSYATPVIDIEPELVRDNRGRRGPGDP